jgi:hypothetical protein
MKRILLFLFLFCFLCSMVYAQSGDRPKLVFSPVINFDQIFVMLRQILIQMFFQYYHLVLGFVAVMLLLSYFQGMLEGRKMRRDRERREREYRRDYRERSEMRRAENRLSKERDLIRRYADVDAENALRIQDAMYRDHSEANEELGLAIYDPEAEIFSGNIDRAGPYWRPDGSEEGSDPYYGDTATISESSTVITRDTRRDRIHRGMDETDDYSGY